MINTGSTPAFKASGTTIAIPAACELTSLDVKNATSAYVHGYAATVVERNVLRTDMWLEKNVSAIHATP